MFKRIPENLDDALQTLDAELGVEDKRFFIDQPEDIVTATAHHSLGRSLRNGWKLWHNSVLAQWFNTIGIYHADDMSGIIITSYWRAVNGVPIELGQQAQYYKDYWAKEKELS
jgi:hypothetical protein